MYCFSNVWISSWATLSWNKYTTLASQSVQYCCSETEEKSEFKIATRKLLFHKRYKHTHEASQSIVYVTLDLWLNGMGVSSSVRSFFVSNLHLSNFGNIFIAKLLDFMFQMRHFSVSTILKSLSLIKFISLGINTDKLGNLYSLSYTIFATNCYLYMLFRQVLWRNML